MFSKNTWAISVLSHTRIITGGAFSWPGRGLSW
jgi:hypothetical protein